MRRGAVLGFLGTFALGLVVLVLIGATDRSKLVYTIGAGPGAPVAVLEGGEQACQTPLSPPAEAFDRVVVSLGTFFKPGPPVEVLVRSTATSRVLARGILPAGYPDIARAPEHAVAIPSTTLEDTVAVCVRNTGTRHVAVYGTVALAHRTSHAELDGKPLNSDLAVRLERADGRSLLTRLPAAFRHAATFKAGFVGAWTFWLLALLAIVAVPALLATALAHAEREGDRASR
jgi:hypothetical protein